jgi:uroporphyrinogen-III synthase
VGEEPPLVAVFRPDDDRLDAAVATLERLGAEPLSDPMLAVEPTGATPRRHAAVTVFTSKTGAELAGGADWSPEPATTVCAIGEATARALRAEGYRVDEVPADYSSSGLVDHLAGAVDGATVEVARSGHGSDVLLDGLATAGADVHETVLYRLVRPEGAGDAVSAAAEGRLDAALFTSSLTVEHFVDLAAERGVENPALEGISSGAVGVIGNPTKETAEAAGIEVDVVPERADFDALARAAMDVLDRDA